MSDKPVWIKFVSYRSGARYDNRDWPAPGVPFEVPEWEAQALVRIKEAVYVADEEVALLSEPNVSTVVEPVPDEEPQPQPVPEPVPENAEEKPAREAPKAEPPKPNAPKAEWVTHAVSQGHDEAAAQAMTKAELQARYGGRL